MEEIKRGRPKSKLSDEERKAKRAAYAAKYYQEHKAHMTVANKRARQKRKVNKKVNAALVKNIIDDQRGQNV